MDRNPIATLPLEARKIIYSMLFEDFPRTIAISVSHTAPRLSGTMLSDPDKPWPRRHALAITKICREIRAEAQHQFNRTFIFRLTYCCVWNKSGWMGGRDNARNEARSTKLKKCIQSFFTSVDSRGGHRPLSVVFLLKNDVLVKRNSMANTSQALMGLIILLSRRAQEDFALMTLDMRLNVTELEPFALSWKIALELPLYDAKDSAKVVAKAFDHLLDAIHQYLVSQGEEYNGVSLPATARMLNKLPGQVAWAVSSGMEEDVGDEDWD